MKPPYRIKSGQEMAFKIDDQILRFPNGVHDGKTDTALLKRIPVWCEVVDAEGAVVNSPDSQQTTENKEEDYASNDHRSRRAPKSDH